MKRWLVTGGLGFLGGHLAELLLKRGDAVTVVDDLRHTPHHSTEALLRGFERCAVHRQSVSEHLAGLRTTFDYDGLFHCASPVGPAGVLGDGGNIAAAIIRDTLAMADLAWRCRSRLLFVSTSETYGGGVEGLCREGMARLVADEPSARLEYAVGKMAAEIALLNRVATDQLDAVIVRPFNIAGPRQQPAGGFVLPRFLEQVRRNQPLTVIGDGSDVRAFTHVADLAEGLVAAMERGKAGRAYNLGNDANRTTILGLAEAVKRVTGSEAPLMFCDGQQLFGPSYVGAADKFPDVTLACEELGWVPTRTLDQIVKDSWRTL